MMKKRKIDRFQYFKYILVFTISVFGIVSIQNNNVYAASPAPPSIGNKVGGTFKYASGCKTWQKNGPSCTVKVTATTSNSTCSIKKKTVSITFTDGIKKKSTGSFGQSTVGTSSTTCNYSFTVTPHNRDNSSPSWGSKTVTLSGATCNKTSLSGLPYSGHVPANPGSYGVTCASSVTAKNTSLSDNQSGVSSSTVSRSCSVGSWCYLVGKDNVGNDSKELAGSSNQKPLAIYVAKDTERCSGTTISITGYDAKYNGYYVGKVTCTAKCTSDNLKVGNARTGTTTGSTCYANACDAAGNCTQRSISVKRDTTAPTCKIGSITSEGLSNGYRLGKVTVTWNGSDSQSLMGNGSQNQTFTSSTNNNGISSLNITIYDRAGNSKKCPDWTWNRDNTAPSTCGFSQSNYSNSSITATAWCTSDNESGCSDKRHTKAYTSNGTFSGANGINVYDLTENYSANPKNYKQCPITIDRIDKAAPSCSAKLNVANPVLSSDGTKWTTNTWHNNSAKVYDENGNATNNAYYRVQASLASSKDNATAGGTASGVKTGYKAAETLNGEAQTTLSEGNQNGIYTVFARDNVVDTVTNSKSGWSSPYLYAHGTTTTGNVGSCSTNVYSFDNTNPVAHVQLLNKTVNGNYNVWSNSNTPQNVAGSVNNNQNSDKFWSSIDVTDEKIIEYVLC